MPKKTTKKELSEVISKTDVLDAVTQAIDRSAPDSAKRNAASTFNREVDKFIKEQRDVLLIAVKIR